MIVAYATHPIAIPLEGAAGKSARNDEVSVSIIEVDRDENAGVTVEVEVTPNGPAAPESDLWTRPGPPDFVTLRMGPSELLNRLELLDASGRELALSWNQDPCPRMVGEPAAGPPVSDGPLRGCTARPGRQRPGSNREEAGPGRAPVLRLRADGDHHPVRLPRRPLALNGAEP